MAISIDIKKMLGEFQLAVQFHSEASRIGILGASRLWEKYDLEKYCGN